MKRREYPDSGQHMVEGVEGPEADPKWEKQMMKS